MPIVCGNCRRTLEFSGDPPTFCAYCGVRLDAATLATMTAPNGVTLAGSTVAYEDTPDTVPEESSHAAPPELIGGYRLQKALGSGGMGTVYEAECPTTGQRVAVKLLAAKFTA